MTATIANAPDLGSEGDAVLGYLAEVLGSLGGLVPGGGTVTDAIRIDRIAMLEQIKGAVAAVQAAETVKFAQAQVAAQKAAGVDYRRLGRGIADQIALAVKVGPHEGSRRLTLARALWFDLPHTYALLTHGQISEYVAHLVAAETNHLDPEPRQHVDQQLAADLHTMAPKEAAAAARKLAYTADPEGSLRRGRTARTQRRVSLRPAPDTMTLLNAFLPVEQGVACYASLKAHTDTRKAHGDPRSRDQIMADTLVERLTGQTAAADVNAEVQITLPIDALLDPNHPAPATLAGHGPIPAWLAHEIMLRSQGQRWWRRLFTAPTSLGGTTVVGGDPSRRRFDGWLGKLITLRDQYCREPFCTALIRHIDHIRRYTEAGPTTYRNGRGVCERHNHTREMPGWQLKMIDLRQPGDHTLIITTPTGHHYPADPPPHHEVAQESDDEVLARDEETPQVNGLDHDRRRRDAAGQVGEDRSENVGGKAVEGLLGPPDLGHLVSSLGLAAEVQQHPVHRPTGDGDQRVVQHVIRLDGRRDSEGEAIHGVS